MYAVHALLNILTSDHTPFPNSSGPRSHCMIIKSSDEQALVQVSKDKSTMGPINKTSGWIDTHLQNLCVKLWMLIIVGDIVQNVGVTGRLEKKYYIESASK